ncbi:oxidoreductase [Sediminicola luteus]|uniref:Oxidoreductase n=1 Tax=Sediminicola luteus TaxID=319238 RepID=A0A2A4GBW4_9FLAO|nr:oxidoreductase [Sediminicola luteus]PCE65901.1 oxidoreductase [Sediminicola luteus]
MKIAVVGGGPGGLYFSILTKKRLPDCTIDVYEQNNFDDAFGFGVVFSDETLSEFLSYDMESYELIRNSFAYWDNLDVARDGEKVRIKGNGFCGCSRKTLLLLLQQRCREEGVNLHFNTRVEDLSQFADADIIVAADGINSGIRSSMEKEFGTSIEMKTNRFVWCGSTKPLDAFTYFFRSTPYGTICAHTYQYEEGRSTWIFECTDETFQKAGFDVTDEAGTVAQMEAFFAEELDGHKLITNRSHWRQFPHVENKNWYHDKVVLLGDSKATAHYSIGSGTKLAMDCAIGLSDAVVANPENVNAAFEQYDKVRRNAVEMIQYAAVVSLNWFEAQDRHMKLDFDSFAFSVMSRSKKITIENQARRDKEYAQSIIHAFNKNLGLENLDTPPAFTKFKIGNVELPNRIVMSPMGQYNANDGIAGDWHYSHYTSRATGGVGLILTEMTAVAPDARITPHCCGIWNEAQTQAWKRITDFVHAHTDSKIGIQLGHAGRKGNCETIEMGQMIPLKAGHWDLVSASPIAYNADLPTPTELDAAGMDRITQEFAQAAANAKTAGFDLIELQAHHGFLLASFISPLTNQRTDEYGGALENRMKFPLRVLEAIKTAAPGLAISVRISATDWAEGGLSAQEANQVAKAFNDAGADIINVSTGNTVAEQQPLIGRMWQSPFSEAIKTEMEIPTITAGYIQDIDQVNTLILNKRADLVALGRPLLLDPYFVRRAQAYENFEGHMPVPKPYEAGTTHLYPYVRKQRAEVEDMKIRLKPVSHQVS